MVENKLEKIQESFETFYRTLYSRPKAPDETQIDTLLNTLDLPTLTTLQNENLIQPITDKELNLAISTLKTGKSPGSDGFTTEWYKSMKPRLAPLYYYYI